MYSKRSTASSRPRLPSWISSRNAVVFDAIGPGGTFRDQLYEDYKAGKLDIDAYLRFALAPLVNHPQEVLAAWHRDFMASKIAPITIAESAMLNVGQ